MQWQRKILYDKQLEIKFIGKLTLPYLLNWFCVQWISAVLDEPLPEGDYAEILKNGVILCKLINKINPTSIVKFKEKVLYSTIRVLNIEFYCRGAQVKKL
jgi:hypothetical protein